MGTGSELIETMGKMQERRIHLMLNESIKDAIIPILLKHLSEEERKQIFIMWREAAEDGICKMLLSDDEETRTALRDAVKRLLGIEGNKIMVGIDAIDAIDGGTTCPGQSS